MDQLVADTDKLEEFLNIDQLQQVGINQADILKLKASGVTTIRGLQGHTGRQLLKIKGFSEAKVEKIKECASKLLHDGFVSGRQVSQDRMSIIKLTTGAKQLDQILGGGVQSKSMTELYGEYRTGKTQICHTLCVTCQLPVGLGGASGKACFIDTEGTFRPERIMEIAKRFDMDPEQTLDNILYARALNSEHLVGLLTEMCQRMVEEKVYKLVVIDSIIHYFRTDYSGRGELSERQQHLNGLLRKLMRVADEYNIAIVFTNQVMSDPGAGMTMVPDPKKPAGGHVIAHAATTRLYLRKGRGEARVVKIVDSPEFPEAEASFEISAGGIVDVAD